MSYATGVVGNATPTVDLISALEVQLLANGYETVEVTQVGTTVMMWRVYRNPAGNNTAGADWYFALGYLRDTAATPIKLAVFEAYNLSTHSVSKYSPYWSGGYPYSTYPLNQVDHTQGGAAQDFTKVGVQPGFRTIGGSLGVGVGVPYWISCTRDRVVVGWRDATTGTINDQGYYVGLIDSFLGTADPVPLVAFGLTNYSQQFTNLNMTLVTREPGVYGVATGLSSPWQGGVETWAGTTAADFYQGSKMTATRAAIYSDILSGGRAYRGFLKHCLFYSVGSINGDLLTYQSGATTRQYVRLASNLSNQTSSGAFFHDTSV